MNNLPKVVAQQRRGRASNPGLLDRKSDASPLSHRATHYSRRFTHMSGHPSAAGRAQDRESLPVKDQRSTTVPSN